MSPLVRIIEYDGVHPKPTTNDAFALMHPKGTILIGEVTSLVLEMSPMFYI